MNYRSLLVLLDEAPSSDARTRVALRLAQQHDCHLMGLAATGSIDLPVAMADIAGMSDYAVKSRTALRERAQRVFDRFGDDCRAAGLNSAEARIDEDDRRRSLLRHARCADLTVLSQAQPDGAEAGETSDLIEQAVLASGRPVLMVPYAGRFDTIGSSVVVAWDDSREAARALVDALPLLAHAQTVHLVSWNEEGDKRGEGHLRRSLDGVAEWLARHGVAANTHLEPATKIDIANAMLSRSSDLDADLIVMGAWGHARWTERMLGGATRGLLEMMTVPVLMSH